MANGWHLFERSAAQPQRALQFGGGCSGGADARVVNR